MDLRKGENVGEMTVAEEGSSEKHLGGGGDNDGIGSVVETCAADCVTCPVCGNTVPGGDDMINSHLGLYLLLIFRLDLFCMLLFCGSYETTSYCT